MRPLSASLVALLALLSSIALLSARPVSASRPTLRSLLPTRSAAVDGSAIAGVSSFPTLLAPGNSSGNYSNCDVCVLLTSYIAPFIRDGSTLALIEKAAKAYCVVQEYGKDCHSVGECVDLCTGIIDEFGPLVIDILANTSLSAQSLCFDLQQCPPPTPLVPGEPVYSNLSDMSGQKRWPSWQHTAGSGTFVHLSDLHFDRLYAPGSSTQCGLDLCCRDAWTVPGNTSGVAGLFGDYQCDSPDVLVRSVLDFLNATLTPRPDFILYTGDDPAHDIWHQNRSTNLAAIAWVSAALLRYFPDIPVLSAVGNHEAAPVNQFGGPGVDSWLYEALVLDWAYYLPNDAQQTLNYGGYYAALVRPGLYVLSINTNIYSSDDFYTKYEQVDVSAQLDWLNDTLQQLDAMGGQARCVLIGHSSPIDWYDVFASEFNALLSRYQHLVLNAFFGHTHHNQVQLYSDSTSAPAHTVGYIGGSITPYTDVNPGVSVYSYDRALQQPYLVRDVQYHWLNLTRANEQREADWAGVKATASSDYQLADLSPGSWWALTESMLAGGGEQSYEAMQRVWYKGLYGGGNSSVARRQCFACQLESDTDAQVAECTARAGVKCGREEQSERQVAAADKCGSYTAEQIDIQRQKATQLEQRKAEVERSMRRRADESVGAERHRHARKGAL